MPPVKFIFVLTLICAFVVVVIVSPAIKTIPAVKLFTFSDPLPPPIWLDIKALIALCVGTIESLSAAKVGSVENSVITAPVPPRATDPSCSSCNPAKLNASALSVAIPVDCSTVNKSPTLKLPSWSVDVKDSLL